MNRESWNAVDIGEAETAEELDKAAIDTMEKEQREIFAGRMKNSRRVIKNMREHIKSTEEKVLQDKKEWDEGRRDFTCIPEGSQY